MGMPSLAFYENKPRFNTRVVQAGYIDDGFFEIFDLIQEFELSDEFASWITNQKFEHAVYKNKTEKGKCIREWEYSFENKSFFFGKLELDEEKIPEKLKDEFLRLNSVFCGIEQLPEVKKESIHSTLTETHCTVISHAIYQGLVIGSLWEIYNLSVLLKIYEKKQDPLRYWRKVRRE